MNRLLTAIVITIALAGTALSHGGAEHVMGTVKAVSQDTITVTTKAGDKPIMFDANTKFMKSGAAATAKDLKAGDRVVIEAQEMGGKLHATEVRFGKKSSKTSAMQQSQPQPHAH